MSVYNGEKDITELERGDQFIIPWHVECAHVGETVHLLALERLAADDEYLTFAYWFEDSDETGIARIHDSSIWVTDPDHEATDG